MNRQRVWLPFSVFAILALAALLLSGLRGGTIRAFALGVPDIKTVAVAGPHRQVCEGPIRSHAAFKSVVIWGAYDAGEPLVRVWSDSEAGRRLVSAGPIEVGPTGLSGEFSATLSASVDQGPPVTVCVVDAGGRLRLQGGNPGYTGATIAGSKPRKAFALVGLESGKHSLLGSLNLAFSRASLFRPSWVGAWTFWLLLILLLATLPLGAFAIAAAIRSETDEDSSSISGSKQES
jgi:hypothetical protein